MLYTAWHVNGVLPPGAPLCKSSGKAGYKKAHVNHPMTKWMRASKANYLFAVRLAAALAREFEYRYGHYMGDKARFAVWSKRPQPPWWG